MTKEQRWIRDARIMFASLVLTAPHMNSAQLDGIGDLNRAARKWFDPPSEKQPKRKSAGNLR